jgi:hypothetical protein
MLLTIAIVACLTGLLVCAGWFVLKNTVKW